MVGVQVEDRVAVPEGVRAQVRDAELRLVVRVAREPGERELDPPYCRPSRFPQVSYVQSAARAYVSGWSVMVASGFASSAHQLRGRFSTSAMKAPHSRFQACGSYESSLLADGQSQNLMPGVMDRDQSLGRVE